jgi:nitroreductase
MNGEMKEKIFQEADRCRQWGIEASGWKWLEKYQVDFLKTVPVIVAVIGDPKKTGLDIFQEEGGVGYQHACAAATQNMLLAAHALGYSSLWFTMFDKKNMREILGVVPEKMPLGLICIGKSGEEPPRAVRKDIMEKTSFVR